MIGSGDAGRISSQENRFLFKDTGKLRLRDGNTTPNLEIVVENVEYTLVSCLSLFLDKDCVVLSFVYFPKEKKFDCPYCSSKFFVQEMTGSLEMQE